MGVIFPERAERLPPAGLTIRDKARIAADIQLGLLFSPLAVATAWGIGPQNASDMFEKYRDRPEARDLLATEAV